eukprot:1671318-Amphidinium_carterae.2
MVECVMCLDRARGCCGGEQLRFPPVSKGGTTLEMNDYDAMVVQTQTQVCLLNVTDTDLQLEAPHRLTWTAMMRIFTLLLSGIAIMCQCRRRTYTTPSPTYSHSTTSNPFTFQLKIPFQPSASAYRPPTQLFGTPMHQNFIQPPCTSSARDLIP